eukprot:CAMPEP_0178954210 /NCGR_PEP_ID=MMETSP0789-20121207/8860_1 /TAXON_ID=3005 /ORGANISM="Rhizosolenia setigera, Strain CCMP 1694" /LENGTH=420 /DNA_ID=CAMNT_0020635579 /DNA_START=195 /DNA_END=1457 /DNA_ORIENTATION=-
MRVVKLRLQNKNNEIRRIAGTDVAEYTQLKKAAMEFSNLPFDKVDEYDIKFIYQDEDGDSITFSTEKEYHEAWLYIPQQDETSTHQVFRMTAMINKKEPSKSTNPTPTPTPAFINGQNVCNGMWSDECAYVVDKMFRKRAMKRAQQHALQYVKEPSPTFIHGRHTCDGCNVKPIIGYRHHSLHIPNYDLCDTCFKSKKGDHRQVLGPFKTVELKRDHPFQELWKKKNNQTHVHTESKNMTDIATLAAKKARKKIEASGKLSDDFPSAEIPDPRCGIALLAAEAARVAKAMTDAMEKQENEYSEASVTTGDSSTKSTKFSEESSSSSKDKGKTTKNNDSGSLDGWENVIQEQTTSTKSLGDVPVHVLYVFEDELKKLHELGFTDDVKSVGVLESLQAANIGVDSNDPVRIETVVERLLNMK